MKSHRLARIAEVIRESAASTILFELKDPRVKNVTVTRVEVAADLQHAKVYVSVMGTEKQQQLALYGLQHAAGFVQSKVAKQLVTRFVPVIQFVVDEGVKKSIEISKILAAEKARAAGPAAPNEGADEAVEDDGGDDEDDGDADEDDSASGNAGRGTRTAE